MATDQGPWTLTVCAKTGARITYNGRWIHADGLHRASPCEHPQRSVDVVPRSEYEKLVSEVVEFVRWSTGKIRTTSKEKACDDMAEAIQSRFGEERDG